MGLFAQLIISGRLQVIPSNDTLGCKKAHQSPVLDKRCLSENLPPDDERELLHADVPARFGVGGGGRGGNDRPYMQNGEQRDRRLENRDVRRGGRERGDRTGGGQETGSPSGSWRSRSDSSVRVSSLTCQTVPLWFGSQAQGRGTLSGFDCSGAGECVLMPACAQRTKKHIQYVSSNPMK